MFRRPFVRYGLPILVLLAIAALPLIAGGETLYLRDVFGTHLQMKWAQAEAMHESRIPVINPYQAGGQALLGNLNAVPLYPDNLLYLVAPFFWAFNAHFWLHLLLAPLLFYWLARAWGVDPPGAWAAAALYTGSGFYLSQLNLYNLVAGVTLAPGLIAAGLGLFTERRIRWPAWVATALLWALLILAGDPTVAVLALVMAASALAVRMGRSVRVWGWWIAAIGVGTLLAVPQLVAMVRILGASFRGHWGYSLAERLAASWHPLRVVEWLVPFPFGVPSLAFWGYDLFGTHTFLFFCLTPGLLALVICLLGARARGKRHVWWAWGLIATGIFMAMGAMNPVVRLLMRLPLADALRFPVKFWLLVAVGAALLGGVGFSRLLRGEQRRARLWLLGLALVYAAGWAILTLAPEWSEAGLASWMAGNRGSYLAAPERLRLAGHCLIGVALAVVFAVLVLGVGRWPRVLGPLIIALHVGSQLFLLRPLLAMEEVAYYQRPPELIAAVEAPGPIVSGSHNALFGSATVKPRLLPSLSLRWLARENYQALYPWAGTLWGRRYELNISAEGLDEFLTAAATQAVKKLDDLGRIRLLRNFGVEYLAVGRPLDAAARSLVQVVAMHEFYGNVEYLYRIREAAPEVALVGTVHPSEHLRAALARLVATGFDPAREAVLAGTDLDLVGPPGRVEIMEDGPESWRIRVEAPGPGLLVLQRAYLPLWRVSVDGEPVPVRVANMYRLAVVIREPGSHRVHLWIDRSPFRSGLGVAGLGLLCLVGGAVWLRRNGPGPPSP